MSPTKQDRQFMQRGAEQAAAMLRTLGNEHRLLLLCLLIEHGELSVGEMHAHVDLSQSALSQHLARMRDDELVASRREAQTVHYRIADPRVETLVAALKKTFCP